MMGIMSFFRRFLRRQDGAAVAEVAILFPLITWPFFTTMEAGVMQMQRIMFERAIDIVARDIRLGNPNLTTFSDIKDAVCDEAFIIPACKRDLMLEMTPVEVSDFTAPTTNVTCVDRSEDVNVPDAESFKQGSINQMMMMRFCILYDPLLPGTGIGARMDHQPGGGIAMVSTTFFVNEP